MRLLNRLCRLIGIESQKSAAELRCRQLDGRAAILVVVARPGGFELAGPFGGSSAHRLFTRKSPVTRVRKQARPEVLPISVPVVPRCQEYSVM